MHIIGHQKIINFLERSIEKDAISHAYLFFGPEHVGKFSLAHDFAQKLTDGENQKINPDIIVIKADIEEKKGISRKKNIGVEKVRELEKELSLSSSTGKYRVAIVDEADRLTISAQNALLKTLEEPEEKCVIILIAHNEQKLLPTIKSRCVSRRFGLVDEKEIEMMLPKDENKKEIVYWSMGRPGQAILMQKDQNELLKRKEIQVELGKICRQSVNENFALAESLAKNTEELALRFDLWTALIRRNIVEQKKDASVSSLKINLLFLGEIEKSAKIIRETNSNPRIILENLFLWLK